MAPGWGREPALVKRASGHRPAPMRALPRLIARTARGDRAGLTSPRGRIARGPEARWPYCVAAIAAGPLAARETNRSSDTVNSSVRASNRMQYTVG